MFNRAQLNTKPFNLPRKRYILKWPDLPKKPKKKNASKVDK